jgi:hypothetical protein
MAVTVGARAMARRAYTASSVAVGAALDSVGSHGGPEGLKTLARWMTAASPDRAAAALLLLLTVPFLGSAYKIDDPLYLWAAEWVRAHPFDPLGGPSFWHQTPATFFSDLYNPPLVAYLLALPVAIAGGREAAVHALMLAVALLALRACAAAGESFGVPRVYTIVLASSPALCVATVSAMTDVPFLLFCALAWGQAARGRGAASGVSVAASAVTKYVGLLNLPLALLALRAPRRPRLVLATVASVLFGAYCLWNLATAGALHVSAAGRLQQLGFDRQPLFAASFVASLGLAGLPAALGLLRWSRGVTVLALVGAGVGAAATYGRGSVALAGIAFGAGAALLGAAGQATVRVRDPFLRTAFWAFAAYTIVLVYFGTARYLLPLLPLLLWLLVRGDVLVAEPSPRRLALSVAGSALLAFLLLQADAGFAEAWRQAARALPSAGRGFHTGRWGFDWYAAPRGYQALRPRERLRNGDVVAEPADIDTIPPTPAQAAVLAPASTLRLPSPRLRVMDMKARAGYYSSHWGVLPLGWRSDASEVVSLSVPDPEILAALERPVSAPVVVDMGSEEASHVELDGWAWADETVEEDGTRRTFVWAVGRESALRIPLPPGVQRVALSVAPDETAVGALRIRIGDEASAVFDVSPGWQTYEAPIAGRVAGGVTDVVLQPAGYHRPGPLASDRRAFSVAVDFLVFGAGNGPRNRGSWPVRAATGRPHLFVSEDPSAGAAP